ncbi:hypothetical protein ANSO36C_02050 [Nostoc cf. commune SO-36]|uniref:Uncharacterized protein n=1 Tax=Nostoc cf. commune SO-36 TaxID=449208 RepID=A0ABN6PZA2_NOSCO|nr:hypothetical protein [Nostoc commune]BDI14403.1 hypothetical protein ANSO36C_02050 [Nostoc cf. commune SO-36]
MDDTIIDLVMDTLGAGLAALISLWALRNWTNRHTDATNGQTETIDSYFLVNQKI